jgi:hypothetical protein
LAFGSTKIFATRPKFSGSVLPARERRLPRGGLAAHARVGLAVLRQELAVARELDDVRVAGTVAANPDVADVIDEDAVVRGGPVVAGAGTTPVPQEVALLASNSSTGGAPAQQSADFSSSPFSLLFSVSEPRWTIQT